LVSLGLPVMVYRMLFLFLASVVTATAVCVSGSIGFVGLVVPHIVRILVGPDHRILLPMAAGGGTLCLAGEEGDLGQCHGDDQGDEDLQGGQDVTLHGCLHLG
ncbi:Transport system permease protein, partial [human gut metagenome]